MRAVKGIFKGTVAGSLAFLVASCGGGSSSNESSAADATIDITPANAISLTREAFGASQIQAGFVAAFSEIDLTAGGTTESASASALRDAYTAIPPAIIDLVEGSAAEGFTTPSCNLGGFAEYRMAGDGSEFTTDYSGCSGLGGADALTPVTLNGQQRFVLSSAPAAETAEKTTVFDDFRLELTNQEQPPEPGDSAVLSASYQGELRQRLTNIFGDLQDSEVRVEAQLLATDLRVELNGFVRWLFNFDLMHSTLFPDQGGLVDELDFRGLLRIPSQGDMYFTTEVPMAYGIVPELAFTQGVLRIDGANGEFIRVSVIEGTDELRIRADTDGDGTIDFTSINGLDELLPCDGQGSIEPEEILCT